MAFNLVINGDYLEIPGTEDKLELGPEINLKRNENDQDQNKQIDFNSINAQNSFNLIN